MAKTKSQRWANIVYPGKTERLVVYVTPETMLTIETTLHKRGGFGSASEVVEHCLRTSDRVRDITEAKLARLRAARGKDRTI